MKTDLKGVREYDRIRRYLENIYLYGFFSRDDFAQAGVGSVKDYDFGVNLIRSIFPETDDAAYWKDGRKYLRVQREYALSGENRMADSYLLCAMDVEEDLPIFLGICSCLTGEGKTVEEVCRDVAIQLETENELNYFSVRRWLLELAEYGYLEKIGRRYQLREDPLPELSEDEVWQLYSYVRFASGVTYPRVAGSFLLRTLERELLRRGKAPAAESSFLLRHSENRTIFDEELICRLMEAIEQHRMVELIQERNKLVVQPAALRVDERLGRWYLLAQGEGPLLLRVSMIRGVKLMKPLPQETWEAGAEACRAAFEQSGCSGIIPSECPTTIRTHLHFEAAPGMGAQFLRELRGGEVRSEEAGEVYQAEINDPVELVPFLRSYSPWLSLEPGEHGLRERIRNDLLRMREQLTGGEEP